MKKVYLDNAATTKVLPEVLKAMLPFFKDEYGNPSEPHLWGAETKTAIENSRKTIADFLGAKSGEIVFTSCATESINLSHKGIIESIIQNEQSNSKLKIKNWIKPHIITSAIEHKAVLETCKHLERLGWATVTYLPVDKYGMVSVSAVEKAIRPETVLVSIMYVNNEVGTIQPIAKSSELLRKKKIYFHIDATQAIQYLNCNVDYLGVDLMSFTGHKIGAPKGIGGLYVRTGVPLTRQMDGGGQERGLRAGTENVPYIVGLGKAVESIPNFKLNISNLRDRLITRILNDIPGTRLTGHPTERAPHLASLLINGVEGESMVLLLSDKGIAASSGSACTSGSLSPSHVLSAMGYKPEESHGSLRLSLSKETTEKDIDYVLKVLPGIIKKLRKMSPFIN